jgi:lipopolysaccharide transport system permease protein
MSRDRETFIREMHRMPTATINELESSLNAKPVVAAQNADQTGSPAHPDRKPFAVIAPTKSWIGIDLSDIWHYRELLFFLAWRDVKIRYKQTVLGVLWALLQPLMLMIIFSVLFGRIAGLPSDGIPYPVFAYAGVLAWTFFAAALASSGNSLVSSANLITKVYFPRLIIPGAAVGAAVVDLFFSFVLLVPLMAYYKIVPHWQMLLLVPLVVLLMLLALGVGMWMSALNVKYRDVRFALPFITQIWFFLTPVIYPISSLPKKVKLVIMINPMSGLVEGMRSALFGLPVKWTALGVSTVLTLGVLIFGALWFRRMEREFADVI